MKSLYFLASGLAFAAAVYSLRFFFWVVMVVMMGWANEPKPISFSDFLAGILSSALFLVPASMPTVLLLYVGYRLMRRSKGT